MIDGDVNEEVDVFKDEFEATASFISLILVLNN